MATSAVIVQGTEEPFRVPVRCTYRDLTTATSAVIYVHRNWSDRHTDEIETWTAVTIQAATTTTADLVVTPQPSGVGALLTAEETIRCRGVISFPSDPDVDTEVFFLNVQRK